MNFFACRGIVVCTPVAWGMSHSVQQIKTAAARAVARLRTPSAGACALRNALCDALECATKWHHQHTRCRCTWLRNRMRNGKTVEECWEFRGIIYTYIICISCTNTYTYTNTSLCACVYTRVDMYSPPHWKWDKLAEERPNEIHQIYQ